MFSSVDASDDPARAIWYLDQTTRAESGIKHYAAAAHALVAPTGFVVDVGCGVGHDLALLASAGIDAVGVDPSAVLLDVARARGGGASPLLRATGEALPFRDRSLGGARVERVLMHVVDPASVLAELVRCLRPGALVTIFEPDWSGFTVRTASRDERSGWVCAARHPDVGSRLWDLLEASGCVVLDRVEELSVWRRLEVLDGVVGLDRSIARAVRDNRISAEAAERWLAEQRARDALGTFHARMPKVLLVARRQ